MSWETDGSAELDAAVKAVGKCSDAEIAARLEKMLEGTMLGWGDFVSREYLAEAARRLRNREKGDCRG